MIVSEELIHIDNLHKSFLEGGYNRVVLDGAFASISSGEFVAIVGKSGSGKSTLLNLISGIDIVDQGHIFINGKELTSMSENERTIFRRENIGFVFQFFNLIPTLTVQENVTLPLELNGVSIKEARYSSNSALDSVGLLDRATTYPDRLSGGEQQRVAIARAVIHKPLLVLADEPTGNLDEDTGRQILKLLIRVTRESGNNMIMVTHNQEAAAYADRILCLREGKLTLQCDGDDPQGIDEYDLARPAKGNPDD